MKLNYMAMVENIYFSCTFVNDLSSWKSFFESNLLDRFEECRVKALREEVFLFDDEGETIMEVLPRGVQRYPYGFIVQDKFRLFVAPNVSENYPLYIIVSAQWMHLENVHVIIEEINRTIVDLFQYFLGANFKFECFKTKLSRIDICNHTAKIDCNSYINVNEFNSRVVTKIRKVFPVIDLIGDSEQKLAYYRYGSGDLAVRFYNKTKEICQQRYKAFFFERWHELGLISLNQKILYEHVYNLNNNYDLDYVYAHFLLHQRKLPEHVVKRSYKIYTDLKLSNDEKYDLLIKLKNLHKIRLLPEITNVEFQVRAAYLKSVKIISQETGEYIDYSSMHDIFVNIDVLYRYLTSNAFRVVDSNSKAKRKRAKTTDSLWKEVQTSKVINIDKFDVSDFEVYRNYQRKFDLIDSARKTVDGLVRSAYLSADEMNFEVWKSFSLKSSFDDVMQIYKMNENYLNAQTKLMKQIQRYGEKTKTPSQSE